MKWLTQLQSDVAKAESKAQGDSQSVGAELNQLKQSVSSVVTASEQKLATAAEVIKNSLSNEAEAIQSGAETAIGAAKAKLEGEITSVVDKAEAIEDEVKQKAAAIEDAAENAIGNAKTKLEGTITGAVDKAEAIEDELKQKAAAIEDLTENTIGNAKTKLEGAITGIADKTEAIEDELKQKSVAIEDAAKNVISNAKTKLEGSITGVVDKAEAIEDELKQKAAAIEDAAENAINTAKTKLEGAISGVSDSAEAIKQRVEQQEAKLQNALHDEVVMVEERIEATEQRIKQRVNAVQQYLKTGVNKLLGIFYAGDASVKASVNNAKSHIPITISHLAVLALLNVLLYLTHTGVLTGGFLAVGGQHVYDTINAYLDAATGSSAELAEITSGIKMILAVLQSTQGGISFIIDIEVQLGQALAPLLDTINYAWKLALASLAATELLKLLVSFSHVAMTPLLTLSVISYGLSVGLKQWFGGLSSALRKIFGITLFTALLTHLLIPGALYINAAASQHLLSAHHNDIHQGFSDFNASLPNNGNQSDLKSQVRGKATHLQNRQSDMAARGKHLNSLAARHLAVSLIEYLLMPLLLLWGLIYLCRVFFKSLFTSE